jgi:hypothetical protein
MIEKPTNGRATINQDFNSLSISIPSKKNWFIIIFMTAWMGGWVMGETFAIGAIFNSDTPIFANAFLLFWLVGWTVGGAFVLYTISWQLVGREIINLERGLLKIEKSVKGIGRKKVYDINSIQNIDINPTQDLGMWGGNYNRNLFGMKGGKIKFDYGMKTIKFANDIDEAEARMVIEKLKENTNLKKENFA